MSAAPRLLYCLERFGHLFPEADSLWAQARGAATARSLASVHEVCCRHLEQILWSTAGAGFDELLQCYQGLFREREALLGEVAAGARHHFIIGIPVADRPAHLRACLESIWQVLDLFGYGGREGGVFRGVQVVVAEDSRWPENIARHRELAEEYSSRGLRVTHFGLEEQYELLQGLKEQTLLGNLLTRQPRDRFFLKGQAAIRNLCYLKFLALTEHRERTLYYLVDSDQQFRLNRLTEAGEQAVHALNYFHVVDHVFSTTDTLVLTGKMVGDPPVSPAVMAGNFLRDLRRFFTELKEREADAACGFHGSADPVGDAAYHDMAALFGFGHQAPAFPYRCRLEGAHDHRACLADLASRLDAFFFGEHLTRGTHFVYGHGYDALQPARTLYPGNYVVNYEGLRYIIPFGHLRLRMSGPTAGRLIAAEIGSRFVSANMPHLHRRTSEGALTESFRPGVELGDAGKHRIDLSDEFERQFFGDLMLFTVERLVREADVRRPFAESLTETLMEETEADLLARYAANRAAILADSDRLVSEILEGAGWWQAEAVSLEQLRRFLANIRHNFGEASPAWRRIGSPSHRADRRRQLTEALRQYRHERDAWDRLFT